MCANKKKNFLQFYVQYEIHDFFLNFLHKSCSFETETNVFTGNNIKCKRPLTHCCQHLRNYETTAWNTSVEFSNERTDGTPFATDVRTKHCLFCFIFLCVFCACPIEIQLIFVYFCDKLFMTRSILVLWFCFTGEFIAQFESAPNCALCLYVSAFFSQSVLFFTVVDYLRRIHVFVPQFPLLHPKINQGNASFFFDSFANSIAFSSYQFSNCVMMSQLTASVPSRVASVASIYGCVAPNTSWNLIEAVCVLNMISIPIFSQSNLNFLAHCWYFIACHFVEWNV